MATITVSTEVKVDLYHAWEYYFNQINGWWPNEYFTSSKTKRFIIDTFIGGKVYEDHAEGGGLVWGDVIGVDYPHVLQIRGNLTREFGGPAITYEKFSFESIESSTRLTYTMDVIGDMSERSIHSLRDGWKVLLQQHFKEYCDKRANTI